MATRRAFLKGLGLAAPMGASWGSVEDAAGFELDGQGPSDVGNLFAFIQGQSMRGEFPLSFLREEFGDRAAWKERARGRFRELLLYDPPPCEPAAEVLERVDEGDHIRERVTFQTTPAIRVPAFVLVPKGLNGKPPAVVALHDHGAMYLWGKEKIVDAGDGQPVLEEFKARYYGGKSIAGELARRGYVVIVIDMFYWGERRMLLDGDPEDWRERPAGLAAMRVSEFNQRSSQSEPLVARTIGAAGFTWPGVMFLDDVRTVDYLMTRPEVDPERIGCVGLSVGGLRSCHLAALHDRIKAAVVVGWMASYPAQLREKIRHTIGFTKLVPGMAKYLDYPDVASMAMPAAMLVINGEKDGLFDLGGVKCCFGKLAACYAKAGIAEKFRGSLYDAPHEFNVEMQREAWEWLGRWV